MRNIQVNGIFKEKGAVVQIIGVVCGGILTFWGEIGFFIDKNFFSEIIAIFNFLIVSNDKTLFNVWIV